MTKSVDNIILTGITTTGTVHLGNYIGAIKPAIAASNATKDSSFFFLADYHALIKEKNPNNIQQYTYEIAAAWLAFGLDSAKDVFYRQSDVPEILEINWILSCMTAKGLLNRAHAYKAAVQSNQALDSKDDDQDITMGLFCYPVLMAADILTFNATKVPVGSDQLQHIEIARDIAAKMNHTYKTDFNLPQAVLQNHPVLTGLDGRKMSKSYGNTIPVFSTEKQLLKLIKKIKTNSLEPGEPKDTNGCILFELFSAFCSADQLMDIEQQYKSGSGWGDLKLQLFDIINPQLKQPREKYEYFINNKKFIDEKLHAGANKAREIAKANLATIRNKVLGDI